MNEKSLGIINLSQEIGFSAITDLVRQRSIDKGFQINILIVGRRGLGASTLINSLFGASIIPKQRPDDISVTHNEILENGISLETSITTYHKDDYTQAIEYINNKNMEYFENEQGPYKIYRDSRIHVCIYMLPSDIISDKEIIEMYEISRKVNFIPVLSKSDMYTSDELVIKKNAIKNILVSHHIRCFLDTNSKNMENNHYSIDDVDNGSNDNRNIDTNVLIDQDSDQEEESPTLPLAIIASESIHDINGELLRGRKYPWGFVNIENEEGNDFKKLQRMLIYRHYDDLINNTHTLYYNQFRKEVMDIERNSESVQVTRYNKLKNEMRVLLREKIEAQIRDLENEERILDGVE